MPLPPLNLSDSSTTAFTPNTQVNFAPVFQDRTPENLLSKVSGAGNNNLISIGAVALLAVLIITKVV